MSEVRTIPSLRFSEFDNQKIYTSRLGDIAEVRDGTHDSPKYVDKGYPLITSKNLNQNGTLSFDNINFISEHDFLQINKRSKVDVGDILFGMIGTIGNPVRINSDGFAIKNVALIKEKLELQNNFLLYYLNSYNIQKQFYRENAGGTQKFIALNLIRNLSINHPSLSEQQKIADFLTAVDKRIELLQKKKTLLETYKKGVMKKIFNQEIRFKDDNGSDFPDWEKDFLIQLVDKKRKIRYGIVQPGKHDEGGRFLIRGKDYSNGWEKPDNFFKVSNEIEVKYKKARVETGDLILCIVGSVGNVMIIPKWLDGSNITQTTARIAPLPEKLNNLYLLHYLESSIGKKEIYKHMRVGTRPGLNIEDVEKFQILIPQMKEQIKISEFLSSIDIQIELLDTQIDKSKTWKKGLLQKMFV